MKPGDFVVKWSGFPRPDPYFGLVRSVDGNRAIIWDQFCGRDFEESLDGWELASDELLAMRLGIQGKGSATVREWLQREADRTTNQPSPSDSATGDK